MPSAACHDRDQPAVRVSEDEQAIGAVLEEDRLDPGEQLAHLLTERVAPHPEVDVGVAEPELLEEDVAEVGVEVLPGVHEHVIGRLVQQRDHA